MASMTTLKVLALSLGVMVIYQDWSVSGDESEVTDPCYRHDVNGCSIPFGSPFFYKQKFSGACNRHDICYDCGLAHNISRHECDDLFRHHTRLFCKASYEEEHTSRKRSASQAMVKHSQHMLAIRNKNYGELSSIIRQEILPVLIRGRLSTDFNLKTFLTPELQRRTMRKLLLKMAELAGGKDENDNDAFEETKDEYDTKENVNTEDHQTRHKRSFLRNLVLSPVSSLVKRLCDRWLKDETKNRTDLQTLSCPDIHLTSCDFYSEVYYLSVRYFAGLQYAKPSEPWCHEPFVQTCFQ